MRKKCEDSCETYSIILEQNSERIAQLMQEQISLINNGNVAHNSYLSDKKEETLNELNEIINRLREIRNVISSEVDKYSDFIECCDNKKSDDVELLIAYYLEAGSRKEEEFLKSISNEIDTKEDLVNLRSLIMRIKGNENFKFIL
ncbi:hypothetical protein [Caldisphaera lagunensis]|uniref:hypothetical protein n=1 Tax=Caldisphaera lagunensis TaxID=200415 RepID=UPI000662B22A|nr:hypothetical protein [Caldisphaera lagunensis]